MDQLSLKALESRLNAVDTMPQLEAVRAEFLGKKGLLTEAMKALGKLQGEDRKAEGVRLNLLKNQFLSCFQVHHKRLETRALEAELQKGFLDVTLPANPLESSPGLAHPLSCEMDRMIGLFLRQGFSLKEGPEIEDEDHNFTFLNVPPHHPARAEHDTFYLKDSPYLLRTHTSCVQIRTLHQEKPPLRMVAAGRVFRSDSDATHTPMFHQIEGLVIEPGIHMGHLKGCLQAFLEDYFEESVAIRFRPSYFPFTTPSLEVDMRLLSEGSGGAQDRLSDWLEVLGCGMVHPSVLHAMKLDPLKHQGFAFGLGVERLLMLKKGVADLRSLYPNSMEWLQHFGQVGEAF